jgi:secreted trypsin-like serine protease
MRVPTAAALGLVLLVGGSTGCVVDLGDAPVDEATPQIIGGSNALPNQFRGVMGLYDGAHLCTATLIHPEWAITAAHCVTPILTGYPDQAAVTAAFYVILDDVDLVDQTATSRTIRLSETIMHPDWNPSRLGDNDLAVLHLAEPVTDRPPMPIYRLLVPNGTPVTQVGYGVNDPTQSAGAGILRVLYTTTTDCDNYGRSDTNLLCFDANDGNGTCFGDSGGPTFVTVGGSLEVAGVTSFGANDQCTGYDASTHIAGELAFVDAHVPRVQGGTPQASDPVADPEIGDPPGLLGGCSVTPGRPAQAGASALLAIMALLSGFLVLRIVAARLRRRR